MRTLIKNILTVLALPFILCLSSCNDFITLTPKDQYTEDQVFENAGLTQALINSIYNFVIDGAREETLTGLTDDAYFTHNYGQIAINEANVSESDLQWYGSTRNNCPFRWSEVYKGIYYANLVLKNIDNVPPDNDYDLGIMKGETYFLRAYLYAQLVRGFGGVPLVTETYGLEDLDQVRIPRSNVGDCLDFILKDIDAALALLPETAKLGRATTGAATALKARICLHIASPLFADRTINTLDLNQYNGDRKALYQQALSAAKDVIESEQYSLVDCRAATVEEIADKYHKVAISNNSEMIFTKQFASSRVVNNLPIQHGPNGYHNWSGTTPTHDLAMSFEMEDGTLFEGLRKVGDSQSGSSPYVGREPRFYANIGHDGAVWGRKRPADSYPLDPTPLGNLQCGVYEVSDGVNVTVNLPEDTIEFKGTYGIDTRQGPIEDWNGSWTGYYEKKIVDTSVDGQNFPQVVPWPHIRLAEMYLIAAEACIELDRLDEAATYLDALRERIGRPDTKTTLARRGLSSNKEDMTAFLRHERRSELSFEDSRYFDVRRWMIASETNNKTLTGITVFARLKPGKTQNRPYVRSEDTWNYHYYVRDLSFRENRKWDDKMYFAPINRDELRRNPELVQNPGM